MDPAAARERLRGRGPGRGLRAAEALDDAVLRRDARMGAPLAVRGDLEGAQAVSRSPTPPIVLASTSPQRRAILEQLGVPFEVDRAELRGARSRGRATRSGSSASMPGARRARSQRLPATRRCSASTRWSRSTVACSESRGTPARPSACSSSSAAGRTRSSRGSACSPPVGRSSSTRPRSSPSGRSRPGTSRPIVASGEWQVTRGRVRHPGTRRGPRRADRRRLPQRRRAAGRRPRAPARGALPGPLRLRLDRTSPGTGPSHVSPGHILQPAAHAAVRRLTSGEAAWTKSAKARCASSRRRPNSERTGSTARNCGRRLPTIAA